MLAFATTVLTGVAGVIGAAFVFQDESVKAIDMALAILDVSVRTAMIGYLLLLLYRHLAGVWHARLEPDGVDPPRLPAQEH